MDFEGTTCYVRFFYGNLSIGALDDFKIDFMEKKTGQKQKDPIIWEAAPVPNCILEGQQICQSFVASVSAPYLNVANLCIRFLLMDATPQIVRLKVPVPFTKFLSPIELTSREFYTRWKSAPFIVNEVTETITILPELTSPLSELTNQLQMVRIYSCCDDVI